jgi:hypothetical protein
MFWQYHVKILSGKFGARQEDITKTCVFLDEAHVSSQNNMFSKFFRAVHQGLIFSDCLKNYVLMFFEETSPIIILE